MGASEHVARIGIEVTATLDEHCRASDLPRVLVERSVKLLPVEAAALMLADLQGELKLVASTTERMRLTESSISQGPCAECYQTGRPLLNVNLLDAPSGWQGFTAAAAATGFRSTHALPMRYMGNVIGALILFADHQEHLGHQDVAVGEAMARLATMGLLHERNFQKQAILSAQLRTALDGRILLEQAKGMLAGTGIGVDEAFRLLRVYARSHRITLAALASAVIAGDVDANELRGPLTNTVPRSQSSTSSVVEQAHSIGARPAQQPRL